MSIASSLTGWLGERWEERHSLFRMTLCALGARTTLVCTPFSPQFLT